MKKLMITAAALMMACAAYGQGQFLFNSHDTAANNVLSYTFNGTPASGSDLFLAVFAGATKDITTMTQLTPLLPLNNTGAKAGYPNPILQTFTVPGMDQTKQAWVAFEAFQGTSLATATQVSPVTYSSSAVQLVVAPTPPNEVAIGNNPNIAIGTIPEPTTLALGFLGLGTLLALRRRS